MEDTRVNDIGIYQGQWYRNISRSVIQEDLKVSDILTSKITEKLNTIM